MTEHEQHPVGRAAEGNLHGMRADSNDELARAELYEGLINPKESHGDSQRGGGAPMMMPPMMGARGVGGAAGGQAGMATAAGTGMGTAGSGGLGAAANMGAKAGSVGGGLGGGLGSGFAASSPGGSTFGSGLGSMAAGSDLTGGIDTDGDGIADYFPGRGPGSHFDGLDPLARRGQGLGSGSHNFDPSKFTHRDPSEYRSVNAATDDGSWSPERSAFGTPTPNIPSPTSATFSSPRNIDSTKPGGTQLDPQQRHHLGPNVTSSEKFDPQVGMIDGPDSRKTSDFGSGFDVKTGKKPTVGDFGGEDFRVDPDDVEKKSHVWSDLSSNLQTLSTQAASLTANFAFVTSPKGQYDAIKDLSQTLAKNGSEVFTDLSAKLADTASGYRQAEDNAKSMASNADKA